MDIFARAKREQGNIFTIMAKYEHLPIYAKAFELVVYLESTVRHFSRYHKYTIGTRLREASWEVVIETGYPLRRLRQRSVKELHLPRRTSAKPSSAA